MREVSDSFLLNMAEVSSALIGLFLVAVLFYAERGVRRFDQGRPVVGPYFRAGTRIVLILYSIPLGLSLSLVVLELVWSRVLFAVLSLLLLAANADSAARVWAFATVTGSKGLLANEVVGSLGVLALVVVPWALGGLHPTREDLAWAVLLSFAAGFVSICALVLSIFDVAKFEAPRPEAARPEDEPA